MLFYAMLLLHAYSIEILGVGGHLFHIEAKPQETIGELKERILTDNDEQIREGQSLRRIFKPFKLINGIEDLPDHVVITEEMNTLTLIQLDILNYGVFTDFDLAHADQIVHDHPDIAFETAIDIITRDCVYIHATRKLSNYMNLDIPSCQQIPYHFRRNPLLSTVTHPIYTYHWANPGDILTKIEIMLTYARDENVRTDLNELKYFWENDFYQGSIEDKRTSNWKEYFGAIGVSAFLAVNQNPIPLACTLGCAGLVWCTSSYTKFQRSQQKATLQEIRDQRLRRINR